MNEFESDKKKDHALQELTHHMQLTAFIVDSV